MDNYHLTKGTGGWSLKKEGRDSAVATFDTKEAAITGAAGYLEEKHGSLKIHGTDGRIEEERTYPRSADPSDTPG